MTTIVFDTETNKFGNDADIVQLGVQVYDEETCLRGEFSTLIKHNELIMHNQEFHNSTCSGISVDSCNKYGMHAPLALIVLREWILNADVVVGHNLQFDLDRLNYALQKYGINAVTPKQTYCTMEHSKNILQLPPTQKMVLTGHSGFKNPKLSETYNFLFGEEMKNAHEAIADVRATAQIYFELKKRGI